MGKTQIGKIICEDDINLLARFLKTLTGEYNGMPLSEELGTYGDNALPHSPGDKAVLDDMGQMNREKS
jgi:hypothetical protein